VRRPSESERRELERLLAADEDELYVLLAQTDPATGGALFAPGEARRVGRLRFDQLLEPVRQRICVEWDYCARRHDPELSDAVTLAAAVMDVISTVVGGIPAATVAALVIKRGLSSVCACP
jgi:hypothetical protein